MSVVHAASINEFIDCLESIINQKLKKWWKKRKSKKYNLNRKRKKKVTLRLFMLLIVPLKLINEDDVHFSNDDFSIIK